jgi:hypothetical protein
VVGLALPPEKAMTVEEYKDEYMKRCEVLCEKLNITLVGFTCGRGFSFDYPERTSNTIRWSDDHMSEAMMARLEKILGITK